MKQAERPPAFVHLKRNRLAKRRKCSNKEDLPICNCTSAANCGASCLNRILNIECDKRLCPAGAGCQNQVIQKRLSPPTTLQSVGDRGWGLFAAADIMAGSFIIEYTGEVIPFEEAERRAGDYEAQGLQHTYIMSLSSDLQIDATVMGSTARFINHSCGPNCETQKWLVGGNLSVGIFALVDITEGSELTYNYNLEWNGGHRVRCLCGAPACIGFIGRACQDASSHDSEDDSNTVGLGLPAQCDLFDSDDEELGLKHNAATAAMFLVKRKRRKVVSAQSAGKQLVVADPLGPDNRAAASFKHMPQGQRGITHGSDSHDSFCNNDGPAAAHVQDGILDRAVCPPSIAPDLAVNDVAMAAKRRKRKGLQADSKDLHPSNDALNINIVPVTTSKPLERQPSQVCSTLHGQCDKAAGTLLGQLQLDWLCGHLDAQVLAFETSYWKLMTGILPT